MIQWVRRAALVGLVGWVLLPLIWAVLASLKPIEEVYRFPPEWVSTTFRWENYQEVFSKLPFARFLVNSIWIAGTASLGAVLTSSMAGYALARSTFRGSRTIVVLVVSTLLIPAPVLLIPRFLIFSSLGWIDSYKPLIVPAWLGGGAFNILLFRQVFRSFPRTIEDAARLDGATDWQAYWNVALPGAGAAAWTAGLLSFVFHWQEFLDPLIYLSDFERYPVSVGLRMYQSLAGTWANQLMAASIVALVPVALLFLVGERYFMRVVRDVEPLS